MSDTSQGPGWWLASDGKWYPPETAPAAAPQAYAPTPTPAYGTAPTTAYGTAPTTAPTSAPTSKANKGCLIAALVVFGLIALVGIGIFAAIAFFADDVADRALGGGPCPFLSDDEASDVLGDGTTATETKGLSNVLVVIDARVMPNEPSCALFREEGQGGGLGRAVRYEGNDADDMYDDELTKAKGVSEDRGNGITVTSDEYFNKEVDDFGDEAFCTTSSGVGAGVLVRDGDTLVYVSVVADVEGTPGVDLSDPDNPKLGTDDAHCELAQDIARRVLD